MATVPHILHGIKSQFIILKIKRQYANLPIYCKIDIPGVNYMSTFTIGRYTYNCFVLSELNASFSFTLLLYLRLLNHYWTIFLLVHLIRKIVNFWNIYIYTLYISITHPENTHRLIHPILWKYTNMLLFIIYFFNLFDEILYFCINNGQFFFLLLYLKNCHRFYSMIHSYLNELYV